MKGAIRLRRPNAAYSTLMTVAMMCLHERQEIVIDETTVDILLNEGFACTIIITAVMRTSSSIISMCEEMQERIAREIETMTPFKVKHVHIFVKRLIDHQEKNA
ncbi:asp23 family protein [Anoxybacillus sp. B7M1]|jgi:hypothetical protein|uniref:hypothetical protein n=1 Tax=unclassified Anoxybacillus TaxID=2639704 RepID=UPI0005CD1850|nr:MULTISPECIES: hypothetical protein [unclassified Anoxybacillus]ANB57714.1 asp23 family protein [Anoxybacillus sp. B2M1]ANB65633.1 asp23 family protein [Anoxybacillus sp. B7M1]